jgi:hypothetical protein
VKFPTDYLARHSRNQLFKPPTGLTTDSSDGTDENQQTPEFFICIRVTREIRG